MKKAVQSLLLSFALVAAACGDKEAPAEQSAPKTPPVAAVPVAPAVIEQPQTPLDIDRDWLAERASIDLQAVADSLFAATAPAPVKNQPSDDDADEDRATDRANTAQQEQNNAIAKKIPSVLRQFEKRFSNAAFQVAPQMFLVEDEGGSSYIQTSVTVRDSTRKKSTFENGSKR